MTIPASIARPLARSLGYENASAVDELRLSFAAEWAQRAPAWLFFGGVAAFAVAFLFYLRAQMRARRDVRLGLAVVRGLLLGLLFLILADPILQFRLVAEPKPALWVLIDGTDSMGIADELPSETRDALDAAVDRAGWESRNASTGSGGENDGAVPTRADYVRALLGKSDDNLLAQLGEKYRLRAYLFDGADGVRPLNLGDADAPEEFDPELLAKAITSDGQVTALGNAIEDVALRHATSNLAGLLVIGDFAWNAGRAPDAAVTKLDVPVYTLGVGARSAIDLEVKLYADLKMKKAEQSTLTVTLGQTGLDDEAVEVRVVARPAVGENLPDDAEILVGVENVTLDSANVSIDVPFRPEETGRWVFEARVEPLDGEVVEQNNVAAREVTIIDDYLRLLFVEYDPTYEWRFVKEVFHRDKLVGLRGFRTFLRSSDPVVRETNELFLPTLTLPRNEFFQYDVIFLSDMPRETLSTRFTEMTREFVDKFGGGLVVLAGPRFGPGELAGTPIGDMLPVVVDPDGRLQDRRPFPLVRTPQSAGYDFMQLGDENDPDGGERAWANLSKLPWYQPVKQVESFRSTVLAEHPTDTCLDGRTKQPLIAIRKFGRGEVVYLGFNETWRLRRKYGERYYRQFWGQLIHRLGLSHALGNQKRFVVRTDRQRYDADDRVLVTVEAYDEDFEPLAAEDLADNVLQAELTRPGGVGEAAEVTETIRIPQSDAEKGLYEVRIPVYEGGAYRLAVSDPVAEDEKTAHFQVTSLAVERRKAVRNDAVQRNLALSTGGKSYELDTVHQLVDDFQPTPLRETSIEVVSLWSTWLCFGLLLSLMLGEWLLRKLVHLP